MVEQAQHDKLMIVAHPDDESLFGGGQLLLEPVNTRYKEENC